MFCLGACVFGITAAFTNFGESGVRGCAVRIRRNGRLKLLLRLREQPLGEVIAPDRGVLGRAFRGWQRGHTGGTELVKLEGSLPECGFGVSAANALDGGEAAVGVELGASGGYGEVGAKRAGLGIVGLELQAGIGLLERGLEVAAAPEGDGEVVVVVL